MRYQLKIALHKLQRHHLNLLKLRFFHFYTNKLAISQRLLHERSSHQNLNCFCPVTFLLFLTLLNVVAKPYVDQKHYEEVIMRKLSSGKCSGIKRPFKLGEIWRIRTRLEIEKDLMQLALLNLAIDSKLRASDLLKLHVYDVSSQGVIHELLTLFQPERSFFF